MKRLYFALVLFQVFLNIVSDEVPINLEPNLIDIKETPEKEVKKLDYDFIVVGGSVASETVANSLSKNPKWNIVLLEPNDDPRTKGKPKNNLYDWNKYAIGATGRSLKESTSTWSWDGIINYFQNKMNTYEGRDATWDAFALLNKERIQAVVDAYEKEGIEYLIDDDASKYMGIAAMSRTKPELSNATKTSPKNLHIKYNSIVTNFNVDNTGFIRSVDYITKSKQRKRFVAKKEYVLSAGTYFSPKILMQSGLGPKVHLKEVGIIPVRDLPVGRNLQDHVVVPFFVKVTTTDTRKNESRLSNSNIDLVSLTSTKPDLTYPDIMSSRKIINRGDRTTMKKELEVFSLENELLNIVLQALDNHAIMVVGVYNIRPKSAGTVRLKSKNPSDPPLIYHNILSNPSDVKTMIRGIRQQQKLLAPTSNEKQKLEEITPYLDKCADKALDSDEFWECYIRIAASPVNESVGTNRMGSENNRFSVVNKCFQVQQTINLRVIDESVIPRITNGPPKNVVQKLAETGANFIKDDWKDM